LYDLRVGFFLEERKVGEEERSWELWLRGGVVSRFIGSFREVGRGLKVLGKEK